ncbi:ninjurin-2 isoform X2 [Contarinia nasturtii]|uniref:ninjurin-2 isoform X2 n=1 Tax=Contarinia nasturtii TaxID=265458 RepID=UPI0012D49C5A|nr:ninjurin-2 isoform X2 [Contarinia nasturtii]
MKKIEQLAPHFIKREIEQVAPKIIRREVQNIAPKVLKTLTPWYIRWFYSLFGDNLKMATSSIAPENPTASDSVLKSMDANRYATKKTIAQGMLDIALLTANASQLKYILQVGQKHEFYTLMLILISVSIIMQLIVGIQFIIIGSLNINRKNEQNAAIILNDVILVLVFLISVVNVIISAFGIEHSSRPLEKINAQV